MNTTFDAQGRALLDIIRQLVIELHPSIKGTIPITLDSSLDRDIRLDSLGRMELSSRIEQTFGTAIPDQAIATAETPRDLLNAILRMGTTSVPALGTEPFRVATRGMHAAVDDATTLIDVLDLHVAADPQRTHIIFSDTEEKITYSTLRKEAGDVAAGLQAIGLQPGQTVAIMLPTGPEYFYSFYGILLAGGIPVPIYPPARLAQVEDHLRRHAAILNNALVSILITVPKTKAVAQLLKSTVRELRTIVTLSDLTESGPSFATFIPKPEDIAFLQYTSGSTGAPKGVVLTHRNLLANIRAMGQATRADSQDVFVSWLPLYHDMGLIGAWLGSLYHAIPLVIMSPLTFLAHPDRWLWAIHHYRGTLSAAPNFAYELCLRKISDDSLKGLDLSSWRLAFNGAEPVSAHTITRFQRRFEAYGLRPEAIAPVYGLAECSVGLALPPLGRSPIIHRVQREPFLRTGQVTPADSHDSNILRFVACGQPLPHHEIRIVNAAGHTLAEREEGHLEFRGPSATQGYFRNPTESQKLFDGKWLKSGDLAYMADGDVFPTGRAKDIIIRAGRNLYPQEIEETVGAIPGIRKGCVVAFGSANPSSGTDRLVVLAETGELVSDVREKLHQEIHTRVLKLLGEPPDDIVLVVPHTILKTSSGKIRHAENRALYERGDVTRPHQHGTWRLFTRLAWAGIALQMHRARRLVTRAVYALYLWLLFAVLAPLTWVMTALTTRLARNWHINHAMARLFVRLSWIRFDIQGLNNLPLDTPCVLAVNHASYLDGILLIAVLSKPFSFVAKGELRNNPITRLYLKNMGTIFVERSHFEDSMGGIKQLLQTVRDGQSLVFFPEGTFYPPPGLLPFRMGAFVTAAQAGVPVVPITICGSRTILRDETWLPRYGAVSITISPPITPKGNDWAAALLLRDTARAQILRLCGERDAAPT
ncbi:MAG: AMP-binding protein [Acidiferrobacter sp.]